MDFKICFLFVAISLCLVQQSQVCEANWFTDLMRRVTGSGSNQAKEAHAEVYGNDNGNGNSQPAPSSGKNTGSWTHEVLAAAAGFEAMRVYERQQAKQKGQPPNHSIVKGILAGLAAAAVDRLIETKGLDYLDAQRARVAAQRTATDMVDRHAAESAGNNRGRGNRDGENQENGAYINQQAPAAADEYKR